MTNQNLIAPCGINCSICIGFLRTKNKCEGCWGPDDKKPWHCSVCKIKNCENLGNSRFCFDCPKYPCARMKQLDKRYRTKYNMSNLDNLQIIKDKGLKAFFTSERKKWTCPNCGSTICVHRGYCLECMENNVG